MRERSRFINKHGIRSELRVVLSTVKYDLKIFYIRYPLNLLWLFIEPTIFLIVFYGYQHILDAESFRNIIGGDVSLASYILVGIGLFFFLSFPLHTARSLQRYQEQGVQESVLACPIHITSYVIGAAISEGAQVSLYSTILTFIGILALGKLPSINASLLVVTALLSLFVSFGLALLLAALTLRYQNIGAIANTMTFFFEFLSGAFIPLRLLPDPIRYVSYAIPFTWTLDLMRVAILNVNPILPMFDQIILTAVLAMITICMGFYTLRLLYRKAMEKGLIGIY